MFELRPFPYPYRAMLAICSDLDETPDTDTYLAIARYLNTKEDTAVGRGVGLEVGNTLYFDMPTDQFSYWNTDTSGREAVHALIRSGHIDCFHSFGDLATTRADAGRALDALAQNDCRIEVWVDHAQARSNLGADIMLGRGDVRDDPVYHADLTVAQGLRYVWIGRVTSCIGQNVGYQPFTGLRRERSGKALLNAAKDAAKQARAYLGDTKYALHRGNRLTRPYTLRDGQSVTEFMRCNPHPHGVNIGEHALGFGDALHSEALDLLVKRGGVSVIYTHLGKRLRAQTAYPNATQRRFEELAVRQDRGELLVATTLRLLDYERSKSALIQTYSSETHTLELDGLDLRPAGLTFFLEDDTPPPRVIWQGEALDIVLNDRDENGRRSFSVPWQRLTFPL